MKAFLALAVLFGLATSSINASPLYLPGTAPKGYKDDTQIALNVNLVASAETLVPFDFYSLPFCGNGKRVKKAVDVSTPHNIGASLESGSHGNAASPYPVFIKKSVECQTLCKRYISKGKAEQLIDLIDKEYRIHLTLDALPVVIRLDVDGGSYIERGYPLGFSLVDDKNKKNYYIFNHIRIIIRYHEDPELFSGSRIVGFEVKPYSIDHKWKEDEKNPFDAKTTVLSTCNAQTPASNQINNMMKIVTDTGATPSRKEERMLKKKGKEARKKPVMEVVYSYDVNWVASEERWSTRWDVYLSTNPNASNNAVHYFSIMNSLLVVLFLAGLVGMIFLRTVYKSIDRYNEHSMEKQEKDDFGLLEEDETGWKLVHADVFRPPTFFPMILSVLLGSGVQILIICFMTTSAAALGFISPVNQGGTLSAIIVLYVLSASSCGYASSRMYKFFGGKAWKRHTLCASLAFPGFLMGSFLFLDCFLAGAGAGNTATWQAILSIFALWACVTIPLTFIGSFVGFKKATMEMPLKCNKVQRTIPSLPWYASPFLLVAVGGLLPFGSVCIEMFFIMSALWLHEIYFVFGFLFFVCFILVVTCALISILVTYLQLCCEDYHWWWRSFITCASSGVYLFMYGLWYQSANLHMHDMTSIVVFVCYMGMISVSFGLLTGSVGFYSSLWFTKKIYGAVKVD